MAKTSRASEVLKRQSGIDPETDSAMLKNGRGLPTGRDGRSRMFLPAVSEPTRERFVPEVGSCFGPNPYAPNSFVGKADRLCGVGWPRDRQPKHSQLPRSDSTHLFGSHR